MMSRIADKHHLPLAVSFQDCNAGNANIWTLLFRGRAKDRLDSTVPA